MNEYTIKFNDTCEMQTCTMATDDFTIKQQPQMFAAVDANGGVKIDWAEAEKQANANAYAKLIIAVRDGTWTPLHPPPERSQPRPLP